METGLNDRAAHITVTHDGDAYVLGRPDLRIYVAVPEAGAVFVTALQNGASLGDAVRLAGEAAGEEVDGDDFLSGLDAAGLLTPAGEEGRARHGRPVSWIEGVGARSVRPLFGRTAWTFYALAAAFAAGVLAVRGDLRPTAEDLWFLTDPVLSVMAYMPVGLLLGATHEAWHWLAGRAVGVPATFRISHRGVYLVFESDLTQLVAIPRNRRYGPFLAGMAFDATVLAAALGLRLLYREEFLRLPGVLDRFLGVVVLQQVLGIVWQWAAVPLRSDGYAVLANALRCHNLYRTTWLVAKDRLLRLTAAEEAELASAGDRDRRTARWFAPVHVLGVLTMTWMFLHFAVPYIIAMTTWVAANVASAAVDTTAFWASLCALAYLAALYGLPPLLAVRERRLRRRGRLR